MNLAAPDIKAPLPPTGFSNIDSPFEATQQLGSTIKFKQLEDPVGVKLLNSRVTQMAPIGYALNAETDFLQVATAYWVDGYVRRILDEYINLILKSGWTIKGENQRAVQYVKLRLRALLQSSGRSFQQVLAMMAYCVVIFGNGFLIKSPFKSSAPLPGFRLRPGPGKKPVGGYFWAHPATMKPIVDFDGHLVEWRYIVNGVIRKIFNPDEVIHLAYNRPPNVLFGQPFFIPVLEDVRTLRQIEFQTVMLLNRYLHPIIHIRRGIIQGGKVIVTATHGGIDDLETLVRDMTPDGVLLTSADVDVKVHGMQGQSIDAGPFLAYWKKRVFGGMGTSAIIMGEAPAGVATADSLTAEMHDMAESFQRAIEQMVNDEIIYDMLLEGGFDPVNHDDEAHFEWNPISLEKEIKARTEATAEWQNGGLTIDEYRRALRREPYQPGDEDKTYFALQAKYGADIVQPDGNADNRLRPAGRYGKQSSPKGKLLTPKTKEQDDDLEMWG